LTRQKFRKTKCYACKEDERTTSADLQPTRHRALIVQGLADIRAALVRGTSELLTMLDDVGGETLDEAA
jgi:hypothetical protein